MPALHEDLPRQVIPRWRMHDDATQRGELNPLGPFVANRFTSDDVAGLLHDWNVSPTVSVASDLVSGAFTLGLWEVAKDAAHAILSDANSTELSKEVANAYLSGSEWEPKLARPLDPSNGAEVISSDALVMSQRESRRLVGSVRRRLRDYPHSPFEWCNLALLYTSLGDLSKASRSISIAYSLAPTNRFVLRAASRFWLHTGEYDRAHEVISRSPLVKSDPWVLAAEIAIADATRRKSRLVRLGKRLIASANYSGLEVSELASAIATLELKSGNHRIGRRIVDISLKDPTENTVAQTAWLVRNIDRHATPVLSGSPEASAWLAAKSGNWIESLAQAERWYIDQPFSSRPAAHASFVAASVLEDYPLAATIARQGLVSNPCEFKLVNNYAFACACDGDIDSARKALGRVPVSQISDQDCIAFLATSGLIEYRSGNAIAGRLLYDRAINRARRLNDRGREGLAFVYLALEEFRMSPTDGQPLVEHAQQIADTVLDPALGAALSQRIRNQIARSAD